MDTASTSKAVLFLALRMLFLSGKITPMAQEKDFYKDIIDNLYDGVYFVDRDRVITYWNKGGSLCLSHCPLAAVMEDGQPQEAEVYLHHAEGHRLPVLVRASAMRDEAGNIVGAVESFSSNASVINARRRISEMDKIARTDSLTRLGNRQHIKGRIRAVIAEFEKERSMAGLLFLDIHHFKRINDTHGHEAGDLALCMVANTIRHALRATDTIGRWGGEEFVTILYDIYDENTLHMAAEMVCTLIQTSRLDLGNHSLAVTASIGVTRLYSNGTSESLIRHADGLMYRSKQAGGNRVTIG